jgi:hypothetical protein
VKQSTYLSAQLRESAPYLKDAGWRQTAALLLAAADEIEDLRLRLAEQGRASENPTLAEAIVDLPKLRGRK